MKKSVYNIIPRTDGGLAVHKNWSIHMTKHNNLDDFEYNIVQILEVYDNYVDVKFLALVKGIKCDTCPEWKKKRLIK